MHDTSGPSVIKVMTRFYYMLSGLLGESVTRCILCQLPHLVLRGKTFSPHALLHLARIDN